MLYLFARISDNRSVKAAFIHKFHKDMSAAQVAVIPNNEEVICERPLRPRPSINGYIDGRCTRGRNTNNYGSSRKFVVAGAADYGNMLSFPQWNKMAIR